MNCCISVALSEIVLRAVSSPVATVTDHGDDQFFVLLVVREHPLEPVAQVVEVGLLRHLRLDQARLDVHRGPGARERLVHAHVAATAAEEVGLRFVRGQDVEGWSFPFHRGLRASGRLGRILDSSSERFPAKELDLAARRDERLTCVASESR